MSRRRTSTILLFSSVTLFVAILYRFVLSELPSFQSLIKMSSETQAKPPIIVGGAGRAGLAASLSALRAGAESVILLERSAKPGGNSIKASSGSNGAPTRFQEGPEEDTTFFADSIKSAGHRLTASAAERPHRAALISILTNNSRNAVEFLADEMGVDLSHVAQLGGHSVPRTHRGSGKTPPGAAIISALLEKLKQNPRFQLRTECEVTDLLSGAEGGPPRVTGVEYTSSDGRHTLHGPVIFATGGFAGDAHGLLEQYRPDLGGMPSSNNPIPGMHSVLTKAGARLVDMDSVQIHPTGFVDPNDAAAPIKFLAAEALRGEGGIMLYHGRRFVNEMETREHVSEVVMALPQAGGEQGGLRQWDVDILLDPGACDAAAGHVSFYVWKSLMTKRLVKDLDDVTRETIREYSAIVAGARKDEFGRTAFGDWRLKGTSDDDEKTVCVGKVTPLVHFTMGGAVINEKAQVLASNLGEEDPSVLEGLWAAGEITGGIHGDNRLGGSSLLECVVFGLAAGQDAADYTP